MAITTSDCELSTQTKKYPRPLQISEENKPKNRFRINPSQILHSYGKEKIKVLKMRVYTPATQRRGGTHFMPYRVVILISKIIRTHNSVSVRPISWSQAGGQASGKRQPLSPKTRETWQTRGPHYAKRLNVKSPRILAFNSISTSKFASSFNFNPSCSSKLLFACFCGSIRYG